MVIVCELTYCYKKFKYVVFGKLAWPFSYRSTLVIFRCCVAQLKIETMRYINIVFIKQSLVYM